jgi:uncharacterized membrane protein YhaH (DUF805 family)
MAANPYESPRSRVADVEEDAEFQPIKMWSRSGRLGRLRYLAYTTGASLLVGLFSAMVMGAAGPTVGGTLTLLAYIPLLIFCVIIGVQRSHDMDWSGWMTLLALIPLVGLIWLFKPGTKGSNTYGNPPPPNTTGVKILGLMFPIIALIGIAAAIALPAYQQYVNRAQMQQQ